MVSRKHTHKYRKVDISKTKGKKYIVFKCDLDCSHYNTPELVVGRKTLCWECNEEMQMTKAHLYKVKPRCSDCRGLNKDEEEDDFDSTKLLDNLGIKV